MLEKEKLYDRIERYLTGKLEGEQLLSFELELKRNPELQEEVKLHEELIHFSQEEDIVHFRSSVNEVIKNEAQASQEIYINRWRYLSIAAGISIMVILSIGIYQLFFNDASHKQLYSTYYEPYEDLITGRSDAAMNDNLTLAMSFYNQGKHYQAVDFFEKIDKSDKPLLQLYLAISYMNIEETEKAEGILLNLSRGNSVFQVEARWYLALTYIQKEEIEKSKLMLEKIIEVNNNSSYKLKASALYNQL